MERGRLRRADGARARAEGGGVPTHASAIRDRGGHRDDRARGEKIAKNRGRFVMKDGARLAAVEVPVVRKPRASHSVPSVNNRSGRLSSSPRALARSRSYRAAGSIVIIFFSHPDRYR